jgi:hypothetical protein
MAFFETGIDVRARDVLVFADIPGSQYDVQFVDPQMGFVGVDHLEVTINLRDEAAVLA